jgi:hypothetical protein
MLQRLRTLVRFPACQQTLDADIFVEIRPVDALASPDEPRVIPLGSSPVSQAWEPTDGHGDHAAIRKLESQRVVAYCHRYRLRHSILNLGSTISS